MVNAATAIATSVLAFIAIREWGIKSARIKVNTFPPIVGDRLLGVRSVVFYLYCANYGKSTVTVRDIRMNFIYKDSFKEEMNRVQYLKEGSTFSTPAKDQINLDYDKNKFPFDKPLEQGKPIKGYVIFEKLDNNHQIEDLEKVEVIVEDSLLKEHLSIISKESILPNRKNIMALQEHSNIPIVNSML